MNEPRKSRFDLSQIGEADWHNLAATFFDAMMEFYKNPENLRRFEEWERQQQAGETRLNAECAL